MQGFLQTVDKVAKPCQIKLIYLFASLAKEEQWNECEVTF